MLPFSVTTGFPSNFNTTGRTHDSRTFASSAANLYTSTQRKAKKKEEEDRIARELVTSRVDSKVRRALHLPTYRVGRARKEPAALRPRLHYWTQSQQLSAYPVSHRSLIQNHCYVCMVEEEEIIVRISNLNLDRHLRRDTSSMYLETSFVCFLR